MNSIRNLLLKQYPELKLNQSYPEFLSHFILILLAIGFFSLLGIKETSFSVAFLLRSIFLGLLYGSLGLLTHELLHGSVIKISLFARILAWFGFFIFGLSPELWLTWHNKVHHFNTNQSGKDPDSFGLWDDFKTFPMTQFILNRSPGSKHFLSYVYLPLNFSNQVMTVMWFMLWRGDQKLYASVHRKVAVTETLLMYCVWILFFVLFGWKSAVMTLVIPSLIANLIVSSYILVQHLFCPLAESDDPLETSLSVSTLSVLDRIHFNFSHHVEHHLFPELGHKQLPRVREILLREFPGRYRFMSHRAAIYQLMTTPRVYQNLHALFDPKTGKTVDVASVGRLQEG